MNKSIRWMAKLSIVAALYAALTLICYPFSFGLIQVRISEALMILVLFDKRYIISLTLGCLIANLFSLSLAGGAIDLLIGTIATLISCIIMVIIKNHFIASIVPAIVNGLLIGYELWYIYEYSYLIAAASVAVGELIAVVVGGNLLYILIKKNNFLLEKITK